MKRLLLLDCLAAFVVAAGVAGAASLLRASDLPLIRGGEASCKCTCSDKNQTWYECDHTTMDPAVTCSTTDCLKDYCVWSECPTTTNGAACPLKYDANAVRVVQDHKNGAPAACNGVSQAVVHFKTSTDCSPWSADGRCEVSSCGGTIISTDTRKGRDVCK